MGLKRLPGTPGLSHCSCGQSTYWAALYSTSGLSADLGLATGTVKTVKSQLHMNLDVKTKIIRLVLSSVLHRFYSRHHCDHRAVYSGSIHVGPHAVQILGQFVNLGFRYYPRENRHFSLFRSRGHPTTVTYSTIRLVQPRAVPGCVPYTPWVLSRARSHVRAVEE